LGKGAGLALLAVSMVEAFTFTQAQFQRILSNNLGLEGETSAPHTHHCGGGVMLITKGMVNHLQVCLVLGRNSAPHDAVREALSHLVVQNAGVTDAAVEADKFLMSQQPALRYLWNTMVASSFWDMRLSIACAATDAEYQNPEPHHTPRQHSQPPRRGAAAPSGPELRAACGGAPRCRRLEDQP